MTVVRDDADPDLERRMAALDEAVDDDIDPGLEHEMREVETNVRIERMSATLDRMEAKLDELLRILKERYAA